MSKWETAKRLRRIGRKHRRDKAAAIMPAVKALCERYDIRIVSNDHGYQFRRNEYIVLWSPGTNKIHIQYAMSGHGDTVQFEQDLRSGNPKVMDALMRLIEVTR